MYKSQTSLATAENNNVSYFIIAYLYSKLNHTNISTIITPTMLCRLVKRTNYLAVDTDCKESIIPNKQMHTKLTHTNTHMCRG